jgi:isoleucyl-tRNA synthetase
MPPPLEPKKTLNLPKTGFSLKANLPQNEPRWPERWGKMGLYAKIRESRPGVPSCVLHDGPPYANYAIHAGHAPDKCLKDFVVFHPDLEYLTLEHKCEFYIVAEALAAATVNSCSLADARTVARFPGRQAVKAFSGGNGSAPLHVFSRERARAEV